MDAMPRRTSPMMRELAAVIVITALAAAARLIAIGEPLWVDELHTTWAVTGDWQDLLRRAAQGNQSPLYFAVVRPFVLLLGPSEFAVRLPSFLAGVLLVPAVYYATRQIVGDGKAAVFAALLVAIDRTSLFYGHEARVYAVLQLLGVLHVTVFHRLWTSPRITWRRRER